MNAAIAHRGPDGDGEYQETMFSMGHRRLSIIELSNAGHQPMADQTGRFILAFNGEIYNYIEIAFELKSLGRTFRGGSDSEVILHAFDEWGEHCVNRFNGMWAFAIWDKKDKKLFLSRDRLGVKPLFYRNNQNSFMFSSEIKALVDRRNNDANLARAHDYLRYGYRVSNGETIFSEINELLPGHNLIIKDGVPRLKKYWELESNIDPYTDAKVAQQEIYELLNDSVKLRFRSDVPVGLLQSGGLDSSIIAKIVESNIEAGAIHEDSVTAFTAIFPGYEHDESHRVRELAAKLKKINLVEISPKPQNLIDELEKFCFGMGEPVQSLTSFVHYQVMKEVKKYGIKVILNGQGADETFAGYTHNVVGYLLLDLAISSPAKFLNEMHAVCQAHGYSKKVVLSQLLKAIVGRRQASKWRAEHIEGTTHLLRNKFIDENDRHLRDSKMKFNASNMSVHMKRQIDYYSFNQILHYEDHSSMMNSIEMRSPFIDYRIIEAGFRLPIEQKFTNGTTKVILRDIFRGKIPDSIVNETKKIGFAAPFYQWTSDKRVRNFFLDILSSQEFRARSIWKGEKIFKIFESGRMSPNMPLWRFINFELWARSYGINNL